MERVTPTESPEQPTPQEAMSPSLASPNMGVEQKAPWVTQVDKLDAKVQVSIYLDSKDLTSLVPGLVP